MRVLLFFLFLYSCSNEVNNDSSLKIPCNSIDCDVSIKPLNASLLREFKYIEKYIESNSPQINTIQKNQFKWRTQMMKSIQDILKQRKTCCPFFIIELIDKNTKEYMALNQYVCLALLGSYDTKTELYKATNSGEDKVNWIKINIDEECRKYILRLVNQPTLDIDITTYLDAFSSISMSLSLTTYDKYTDSLQSKIVFNPLLIETMILNKGPAKVSNEERVTLDWLRHIFNVIASCSPDNWEGGLVPTSLD